MSIVEAAPSLQSVVESCRKQNLSCDDLPSACAFAAQLARIDARELRRHVVGASVVPTFAERLVLYSDGSLEVRAHLFAERSSETYVHDHQISFISVCIQGSYLHKIHAVLPPDAQNSRHVHFRRQTGGLITNLGRYDGEVSNVLAQPFEAGQSLFISSDALHSVETIRGPPVITLTFRQLNDASSARPRAANILSNDPAFKPPPQQKTIDMDGEDTAECVKRLTRALRRAPLGPKPILPGRPFWTRLEVTRPNTLAKKRD